MLYRHELKYLISYGQLALVRARMGPLLKRDDHVTEHGCYTVRSLYFDDYGNTAYNDKLQGGVERQKFRIRIYNGSERVISLERKSKSCSYTYKQSARLLRAQVHDILDGQYDALLGCPDPLFGVFYHECRSKMLRPRVIVDYEREPYVMQAGTVRITFDTHIRAAVGGWDIFDDRLATLEVLDPGLLVMEVKYTEFLPSIVQRALPQGAVDFSAVSKYMLACDRTLHRRRVDS
jgi:hypothetical protein